MPAAGGAGRPARRPFPGSTARPDPPAIPDLNTPPPARPAAQRLHHLTRTWQGGTLRVTRALSLALGALVVAFLGAVALPVRPWGALSLAVGFSLAAALRGGQAGWLAAAGGLALALITMSWPLSATLLATGAVSAGAWLAWQLLRLLAFDNRLERARDIGWLSLAHVGIAAPVAALLAGETLPFALTNLSGHGAGSVLAGGFTLAVGGLLVAYPLLASDRRMMQALQPHAGIAWTLTLMALPLLATVLLGTRSLGGSGGAHVLLFLPPVLLVALALHAGGALASAVLLLVALVGCMTATPGPLWWGMGSSLYAGVGRSSEGTVPSSSARGTPRMSL